MKHRPQPRTNHRPMRRRFLHRKTGRNDREARRSLRKPACSVCGQEMSRWGGYAGTGLCGPCCTGEAASMTEYGINW